MERKIEGDVYRRVALWLVRSLREDINAIEEAGKIPVIITKYPSEFTTIEGIPVEFRPDAAAVISVTYKI